MVKGKSKGPNTKGNDGSPYYLLVDPRPGEAPDYDNSTLVQSTGTGRSLVSNRDVMDNTLQSQHLKSAGTYEGEGGGQGEEDREEQGGLGKGRRQVQGQRSGAGRREEGRDGRGQQEEQHRQGGQKHKRRR